MCTACEGTANGAAVCSNGVCSSSCQAGYKLCGSACVTTANDVKNCGACGHDCTALPHLASTTGVTCAAGACVIQATACANGFAHCTSNPDDGCETDIATPEHCKACTTQCTASNPICTPTGCGNSCPAATPTLCGGSCVDLNSDPKHCGDCARACSQPTSGGNATCEQKTCTLHCLAGYHACGTSQCASDTDATQCEGPACHACAASATGDPQCTGNACGLTCHSGYHSCKGACVTDTDPANCGSGCITCPGPVSGPGMPLCSGGGCTFTCNQGYHACGNSCFLNTDPNHCGDSACTPCNGPPSNGAAVCSGGNCGIGCNNLYHACGNNCVSNATYCSGCTACFVPANGSQTCNASGGCDVACSTGYHTCNGDCISNTGTTCGGCTPCPGPAHGNGMQSCTGVGACDVTCNVGYHKCGGDCWSDTDASHCGTSCAVCSGSQICYLGTTCKAADCTAANSCGQSDGIGGNCNDGRGKCSASGVHCVGPNCTCDTTSCGGLQQCCGSTCCSAPGPNMNVACNGASCVSSCNGGTTVTCSNGSRPCGTWSFESNSTEGWQKAVESQGTETPGVSSGHQHSGTFALTFPYVTGSDGYLDITVTPCTGSLATVNTGISGFLYLDGPVPLFNGSPSNFDVTFHYYFGANPGAQDYFESEINAVPVGTPFNVRGASGLLPRTDIHHINIEVHVLSETAWSGTAYLDDVVLR